MNAFEMEIRKSINLELILSLWNSILIRPTMPDIFNPKCRISFLAIVDALNCLC